MPLINNRQCAVPVEEVDDWRQVRSKFTFINPSHTNIFHSIENVNFSDDCQFEHADDNQKIPCANIPRIYTRTDLPTYLSVKYFET